MNYKGTIIRESLQDNKVPEDILVVDTKIEKVTPKHETPWLSLWTLYSVEIRQENAEKVAQKLSKALDYSHGTAWYADFKNLNTHYIIFKNKVFKVNRKIPEEYTAPREYGMALGIPEHQVDFSPHIQ